MLFIRSFTYLSARSKLLSLIGFGIILILILISDHLFLLNFYVRYSHNRSCHCLEQENTAGRCSNAALRLGRGQRVVSYSLFGPRHIFERHLDRRLAQIREWYPGWVMRIYSDWELLDMEDPCRFICENPSDVYWCDVRKVKESKGIMQAYGMTWRFIPIIDPLVGIFISRDLDANIIQREREAVARWEESDYVFHFMRDHIRHTTEILGGMWGAKVSELWEVDRTDIYQGLITFTWGRHIKGVDQHALTNVIYRPKYWRKSMAHDEYFCKWYKETFCIPFPSPRNGTEYVPSNDEDCVLCK